MFISSEAVAKRTTSAFPISIGTALALESIFQWKQKPYDPDRKIPNKIDLSNYNEMWINLMTLFRNIYGSIERQSLSAILPGDLAFALDQEVEIIKDLIKEEFKSTVTPVFYACKYAGIEKQYPHAKIRTDNTIKQKEYTDLMQATLNRFLKLQPKENSIKLFDLHIKTSDKNSALILTNYAHDLLSYASFSNLDLIESHTGILKSRSLWNTKLYNNSELVRIPFNRCFLQVFGDSQTFFPMDKNLREDVLKLAEIYKWNSTTTNDRLRLGFSTLKNTFFRDILNDML